MKCSKSLIIFLFCFILMSFYTNIHLLAKDQQVCKDISAPEVKHMLTNGEALVVHVMSSFEYEIQHIKNSINIPVNKIMKQQDKLPKDKSYPVIFYCMGKR